ncbi:hypothetical protein EDC01DRAFT_627142 [Geopyxis carbonaria]|nr:hypothetical protein EDC01DRAFT_627142 [Geopyxis carbonaria]
MKPASDSPSPTIISTLQHSTTNNRPRPSCFNPMLKITPADPGLSDDDAPLRVLQHRHRQRRQYDQPSASARPPTFSPPRPDQRQHQSVPKRPEMLAALRNVDPRHLPFQSYNTLSVLHHPQPRTTPSQQLLQVQRLEMMVLRAEEAREADIAAGGTGRMRNEWDDDDDDGGGGYKDPYNGEGEVGRGLQRISVVDGRRGREHWNESCSSDLDGNDSSLLLGLQELNRLRLPLSSSSGGRSQASSATKVRDDHSDGRYEDLDPSLRQQRTPIRDSRRIRKHQDDIDRSNNGQNMQSRLLHGRQELNRLRLLLPSEGRSPSHSATMIRNDSARHDRPEDAGVLHSGQRSSGPRSHRDNIPRFARGGHEDPSLLLGRQELNRLRLPLSSSESHLPSPSITEVYRGRPENPEIIHRGQRSSGPRQIRDDVARSDRGGYENSERSLRQQTTPVVNYSRHIRRHRNDSDSSVRGGHPDSTLLHGLQELNRLDLPAPSASSQSYSATPVSTASSVPLQPVRQKTPPTHRPLPQPDPADLLLGLQELASTRPPLPVRPPTRSASPTPESEPDHQHDLLFGLQELNTLQRHDTRTPPGYYNVPSANPNQSYFSDVSAPPQVSQVHRDPGPLDDSLLAGLQELNALNIDADCAPPAPPMRQPSLPRSRQPRRQAQTVQAQTETQEGGLLEGLRDLARERAGLPRRQWVPSMGAVQRARRLVYRPRMEEYSLFHVSRALERMRREG